MKLLEAIHEVELGSITADLGGGLIKQRVAREGGGKSGGYRTIIAYRVGNRSFFIYGFSKNAKDNLKENELAEYKRFAGVLLSYSDTDLTVALNAGMIEEIAYYEESHDL